MRVAFYTLGCKVNQYETEVLSARFAAEGFDVVPGHAPGCDVYVVGSCTVTAEGDRKTRQAVRRFRRENPGAIVVLTGCYPQAFPREAAAVQEADIITGARNRAALPQLVRAFSLDRQRIVSIPQHEKGEDFESCSAADFGVRTRAFLKIQDGCDNWCSYCIIPAARGPVRSKPMPELQSELLTLARNGYREISLQGQIEYSRTFGKHDVNALFVYHQKEKVDNQPANDEYKVLPYREQGLAGRFTYGYDNRYLMEFNFGYNGSENFISGRRFGFFPSIAGAWVVSGEPFWEGIRSKVNLLKIRASYGLSGNDYLADSSNNIVRFPYLTTVNMNKALYVWFSPNFVKQTGHEIKTVGNPLATWEESTKLNVGLELGLFDALTLNVDVYKENRTGIFMQRRSLPSTMGLSGVTPYGNLGEVENRGVDVSLEYNKAFNKDLLVSVRGTFTYAHNEVKARDEAKYLPNKYNSVLGKPVNSVYGLVADGLFASQEEIDNSPRQTFMPDYLPGDIKYRDLNGDGVIDANDRTSLGYPTVPEILYGFGASVNYKRWDFSFFFQGTARVSLRMYDMHPFRDNQYSGFNMTQYVADDHWSEADPNPNAAYPRLDYRYNANNTQTSSFWIKNGSYLRLKSVELGFTYKSLRAYLAGTNLFIISPFKYWDPEMGSGNGLKYPLQRVVKLGLQYNF